MSLLELNIEVVELVVVVLGHDRLLFYLLLISTATLIVSVAVVQTCSDGAHWDGSGLGRGMVRATLVIAAVVRRCSHIRDW